MKDTILVYKKGEITINPQYVEKPYWDTHYNLLLVEDSNGEKQLLPLKNELVKLKIIGAKETITRQTISNPIFFEYVCSNKDKICCLNPIHASNDVMEVAKQSMGRIVKYKSSRGNVQYFYNGRQIGFFNQCFHDVDGEEKLSVLLGDIWTDIDFGNTQNEGGVDFPAGKKAEMLLRRILSMTTEEGDVVLDFFGGSGTTASVAHKMNRRYISCEQLNTQISMIKTRLQNVIAGDQSGCSKSVGWNPQNPDLLDGDKYAHNSFVYCELAQANQQLVDEIMAANEPLKLQEVWALLQEKGFLSYKVSPKMFNEHAEDFNDLSLDDQKRFLIECLDKNMLYIPYSDIDDEGFTLSENDKQLTRQFYASK